MGKERGKERAKKPIGGHRTRRKGGGGRRIPEGNSSSKGPSRRVTSVSHLGNDLPCARREGDSSWSWGWMRRNLEREAFVASCIWCSLWLSHRQRGVALIGCSWSLGLQTHFPEACGNKEATPEERGWLWSVLIVKHRVVLMPCCSAVQVETAVGPASSVQQVVGTPASYNAISSCPRAHGVLRLHWHSSPNPFLLAGWGIPRLRAGFLGSQQGIGPSVSSGGFVWRPQPPLDLRPSLEHLSGADKCSLLMACPTRAPQQV